MFAYNTQVHKPTKQVPLGWVLLRPLVGSLLTACIEKAADALTPTEFRQFVLKKLFRLIKGTRE